MDIMNIAYTPYLPDRQLPRIKAAASVRPNSSVDKNSKLYKVSVESEAIFIKQMRVVGDGAGCQP